MDIVTNFLADTTQMKSAEQTVKKVGVESEKTAKKVANLGKNMRMTKGPTSALSTTSGQLAVQFQDVAVQAQMGTDALRIFGQQGPQILSVFGPKGAVIGAVAAIGAAVLSSIIPSFGRSKDAIKEFADSVKTVGDSVETLTDDFFGLSESLVDLAQKSEAAARLQIAIALDAADIAAKNARDSFDRLGLSGQGMNRALKEGSQASRDFAVALEDLSRGDSSAAAFSVMKRAADGLGVSIQDIKGIHESYLKAIDPNSDGAAIVAFAENLSELAINSSDPAFRSFANRLLDIALKAETTEEKARLLNQAMSDFGKVANGASQESIQFVKRLEEQADAIGKTRLQVLALQAARIEDDSLRARAEEAIKLLEFEEQVKEDARTNEKRADEEKKDRQKAALEADKNAAAERRRIRDEDKELRQIDREQEKAEQKEQEEREKRVYEEQLRMMRTKFEEFKKQEEERKRIQNNVTDSLLAFEDKLMKGKSEKQKAAFRLGVNLANAEKRENAKTIVSDSYTAAMKAYKALAGIPIVGPALGAAAAGVILAAGVSYATQSLAGRALGGQVRDGESYVVGERGPEVLTMGSSGRIIPNDQLRGQQQMVNKTTNVTFQISTVDARGFDQLLQSRRGQIISMINSASNDKGRPAVV